MSISSSCAVPTSPTNVSATVTGCDSAEVTWGASVFMSETMLNYRVMYQQMNGGAPTTNFTTSTNITLQNLQPNTTYTVSVVGINSCGGTSEFANTTFQLQGNSLFMDCHITVLLFLHPHQPTRQ